jgi:hypothetical protein
MIEYVNGMGDYWIRLVEQMIPASTIWNSGVKLENSIFHRQKFVWRRQRGCELVPILCTPCKFTSSIYQTNCNVQSTLCPIYPDGGFTDVLKYVISNDPTASGCDDLNSISSVWYVILNINGIEYPYPPFFNGLGYFNTVGQSCLPATPCLSDWATALDFALTQILSLGYDYRYETNNNVVTDISDPKAFYVRIWNTNCSETPLVESISINIGINFSITC